MDRPQLKPKQVQEPPLYDPNRENEPPEPAGRQKRIRPEKTPGKRGRPAGSKNKKPPSALATVSHRNKIIQRLMPRNRIGELPHEFLWRVSQGLLIKHGKKKILPTWDDRVEAAKAAAPYYAPKLSTVEVIKGVEDADLLRIIESAAAAAGISIRIGGVQSPSTIEGGTGKVLDAGDGTNPRNPYLFARRSEQPVS